jgi:hypothetical protein
MKCSDCGRYRTPQCYSNPQSEDWDKAESYSCFISKQSPLIYSPKETDGRIDEPIIQAKGIQGELTLFADRIRIKRGGVGAFFTHGLAGEKDIFIKDISSVQFKAAGALTNGYIQFAFISGLEAKRGIIQAAQDENTIMFKKKQQPDFEYIRDRIQHMKIPTNSKSATSNLDELEKLASLRERGIITEQEFEAKKRQLLNL